MTVAAGRQHFRPADCQAAADAFRRRCAAPTLPWLERRFAIRPLVAGYLRTAWCIS